MSEPKTHTLEVAGAVLHYDVREAVAGDHPTLLLIGSPMDASGFVSLATRVTDRTVVTYDPRGVGRSPRTDGDADGRTTSTPDLHADDLHELITALGAGPVDIFASSGGAVNALALVTRHPGDVRTLVAHEPPALTTLPDREPALAAVQDMRRTYDRAGAGPAMVKFITATMYKGEIPADFAEGTFPDPAQFGMSADDDGSRNDALLGQNLVSCTHYEPDFAALGAAPTRVVVGVGADSEGEMAHRCGAAIAGKLGTEPVTFPGGHAGFLGGEYGMTGEPDAFAATLRTVLDDNA